jgi:hypothetical protein
MVLFNNLFFTIKGVTALRNNYFMQGLLCTIFISLFSYGFAFDGPAGQLTIEAKNYSEYLSSRTVQLSCEAPSVSQCSAAGAKKLSLTKSTGKDGDNYSITYNNFMGSFFGKINCVINSVTCTLTATTPDSQAEQLSTFTIKNMQTKLDSKYQPYWQATLANAVSDEPAKLAVTTPSTSGSALVIELNFHDSTDGRLTINADLPNKPSILKCDNNISLTAQVESNKQYFNLSAIFIAAGGTMPTNYASLTNCKLEDSKGLVYATYNSISQLGTHDQNQTPKIWAAEYSAINNGFANYLTSDVSSVPVADDAKAYNQMQVDLTPITEGELTLNFKQVANQVSDVYVQCDGENAIKATENAGIYSVNLWQLHGTDTTPRDVVNYQACKVQNTAIAPTTTYAKFEVAKLRGDYRPGAGGLPMWAMEVSNITPEYSEYIASTKSITSNCDYQDAKACNGQEIDFTIRKTPTAGSLILENAVATPPAKLICDNHTFTATISGNKESFDFETLHNQIDAAANPIQLQTLNNCKLEDSATTPNVYASIGSFAAIGLHDANTQRSLWAAAANDFTNGIANYIVTINNTTPSVDDPSAYNQYAVSITPITLGQIVFTGAVQDETSLYVRCDNKPPIALTAYKLDLRTLHGTDSSPTNNIDYQQCSLISNPAKTPVTTYATFKVTGIKGNYATSNGGTPMWATEVSDIANGNSTYTVNTMPTTSTCDYQNNKKCNQTGISFYSDAAHGYVDIFGSLSNVIVSCASPSGVDLASAISKISGGIRIDLAKAHDLVSTDRATDVTYANCKLENGPAILGRFDLSAINGSRAPEGKQSNMWSTKLTNLQGIIVLTASSCDSTGTYCNYWRLRDTV